MPVPDIGYCATLGRPLNFDDGTLEGIWYTEGTVPPAPSTDVALSGTYSLKCTVASGVNRSLCEYSNTTDSASYLFADATEAWFAFDMYISDYTPYNSYNIFMYWSHGGTAGTSGFGLRPVQNTSNWELYYNAGSNATGSLGAMALDTWERWVFHIKFNQDNAVGEINVWRQGTQIVTALKPSAGTYDETQGTAITWRLGFNRDAASTTLNTMYFDNIAVGSTRAKVEDIGPAPTAVVGTATMPSGWSTRNASLVIGGTSKQGIWV